MKRKGGRPSFSLVEGLGHIEINKRINANGGLIRKKLNIAGMAGLLTAINQPLEYGQTPEGLTAKVTDSLLQIRDAWVLGRNINELPKSKEEKEDKDF